jgi:predicted GTPase
MDGKRERIVIMGAAGRDFHSFNQVYRHEKTVEVLAFTRRRENHLARSELQGT